MDLQVRVELNNTVMHPQIYLCICTTVVYVGMQLCFHFSANASLTLLHWLPLLGSGCHCNNVKLLLPLVGSGCPPNITPSPLYPPLTPKPFPLTKTANVSLLLCLQL